MTNEEPMKKSIDFLPLYAQQDLKKIVNLVLKEVFGCEMIILYGSYARGTFVQYDERNEFGILTSFMSDYDILVLTSGMDVSEVGHILDNIDEKYYRRPDNQTPIQFINDDIDKFNSDLRERRYFYTDIKKEGIELYNSGNYKLERGRKLNFSEIREQAEEYYNEKFDKALSFLRSARHDNNDGDLQMCAFHLHQATENFFYTFRLVFTLKNSKQHNLMKLLRATRSYSDELRKLFPISKDKEEKRLFELLKKAYVEARYNPNFVVTKEDIEALLLKVERLRDITEERCKERLREYEGKEEGKC